MLRHGALFFVENMALSAFETHVVSIALKFIHHLAPQLQKKSFPTFVELQTPFDPQ